MKLNRATLSKARRFLAPHWKKREMQVGRIKEMGDPASYGQCDFSAVFLQQLFGGSLRGGHGYRNGHPVIGGLNGELHYWLELPDGRIVDITADQYKLPRVVLALPGTDLHRSYASSFTDAELAKVNKYWQRRCKRLANLFVQSLVVFDDDEPDPERNRCPQCQSTSTDCGCD